MVYYNQLANKDLNNIFIGLIIWKKHQLSIGHVLSYVADIEFECESLDKKIIHDISYYSIHKKFGEYVHRYKRNQHTTWYIIYNVDVLGNVWIERIINNHLTISE